MVSFNKYLKSLGIPLLGCLFLYLLDPFYLGFVFGWLLVVFLYLKKEFLLGNLDGNFVLILAFSIIYALFYSFDYQANGRQFIINYALIPPGFYLLGKYIVNSYSSHKHIFKFLILIGFVFSLSAMVSVLIIFSKTGFNSLDRNLPMFWNGNIVSATNMGAFFLFNMCLPGLLLIRQLKLGLSFKIFGGVIYFLSLICVLRLGSRTQLVISLLATLICVFYSVKKQSLKKNTPMFIMIVILGVIIATNVSFDKNADWMTLFASRMDDSNNVASAGGRSYRWERAMTNIFTKPLGWSKNEFGFSHNLWFDVAMVAGVIPMLLLMLFSVKSLLQIRRSLKIAPGEITFNALVVVFSISIFLLLAVEPIMVGYFKLFSVFCIFVGIIVAYNKNYKNRKPSPIIEPKTI